MDSNTIERLRQLNCDGKSNRQIATILGIHHNTVSYQLKKLGLSSSWANETIEYIDSNTAKCSKCKTVKQIKEFQHGRRGQKYEYKFSYCNKCRRQQCYMNLNSSLEKFLGDRYHKLRRRSLENGTIFTITLQEFVNQYKSQAGKCFYSDRNLVCKVGSGLKADALSVDKIIPEKGYIVGNVVFCVNKINTCKNNLSLDEIKEWMPGWYERIQNFIGYREF